MKDECLICGAPLKYLETDEVMECDVGCPFISRAFDDDWGLPDPTGKNDAAFIAVIKQIEANILKL